jgi:hypothetical protein
MRPWLSRVLRVSSRNYGRPHMFSHICPCAPDSCLDINDFLMTTSGPKTSVSRLGTLDSHSESVS